MCFKNKILKLFVCLISLGMLQTQILNENFESGIWPPAGWTIQQIGDPAGWSESSVQSHSTTRSAFHDDNDVATGCNDWLISPSLNLSSITSPSVTYWEHVNYASWADEHNVKYSTDYSGTGDPTAAIWTTLNAAIGAEDTWAEFNFSLPSAASVYIAFQYTGDYAAEWWIDDVLVEEPASCPEPTDLAAGLISSSSASLSWTAEGAEPNWNMEWGPQGFTQGTGTLILNTAENPYALSGLEESTAYDWYVQADCDGAREESAWSGPSQFTTLSASTHLQENFENGAWLPLGWIQYEGGNPAGWAESTSQSHSTNHSAFHDDDDVASGCEDWLISPELDLSSATNPMLTYWEYVNYADWADQHIVQYSTNYSGTGDPEAASWTVLNDVIGADGSWNSFEYYLPASASVYVAFYYTGDYASEWWIDDVTVENGASCPPPSSLVTSAIGSYVADLGWTVNGSETNWNIEWGPNGFSQGSGTIISNTEDNPYNLTGLTENTAYDWYVQADCDGGAREESPWVGPAEFTTLPGPHSVPMSVDFETGFSLFDNDTGNTTDWTISTSYYHGGSQCAYNDYGFSNINILHETGVLDLSGLTNAVLEFWHIAKTQADQDKCTVEISTDGGINYSVLPASTYLGDAVDYAVNEYFHETSYTIWGTGNNSPDNATWWKQESFNLDDYRVQNVRLRFVLVSNNTRNRSGWYVDDIQVYEAECPFPDNLAESSIGLHSVNLEWNVRGSETAWNMEWGPAGFTPGTGTLITLADTNPYNLTGLEMDTSYDWYVQADCDGSRVESSWSGLSTFTTSDGVPVPYDPENGATSVLTSDKYLDWIDVIDADSYLVSIGTESGLWDLIDGQSVSVSDYTYTGPDWDPDEDYYWQVTTVTPARAQVVGEEWNFTTACSPFAPPYLENFDGTTIPNLTTCWAKKTSVEDWYTDAADADSAPNCTKIGWDHDTALDDWMFTPAFQLTGGTTYYVNFWYRARSAS